jgi:16S rRNA (cytosine967-C5)-methyltransferase
LRGQRDLWAEEAAQISHGVFSYFRWLRWLDQAQTLQEQIKQASRLAEQFTRDSRTASDADLLARVIPEWIESEMEITTVFARALQSQPKLWLRAHRGQGKTLAQQLGDCRPFGAGTLSDILEYCGNQDLFRTAEFHRGEFEVQDISSQAVGLACAPSPGELWWDACAGEGGKLLHLSDLMENQGLIWASDRAVWRLQKLKRRAARAKVFNYRAVSWNGGPKLPTKTKFNGVLVDAPCTGTGTWQRNPDSRWTTTAQDVKELSEIQKQLLANASRAVKPGGKLIYAVCTLTRSETTAIVAGFSQDFPEFEPLKLSNPLEPRARPEFQIRICPHQFGGNGMFITAWERK